MTLGRLRDSGTARTRGGWRPPLCHHFDPAIPQSVDTADYFQLTLLDRGTQDRRRGIELADVIDHVLPDGLAEHIAGLLRDRLHRGCNALHERRHMSRQRLVVLERFDGGIDRAAALMAEHH